MIKRFMPIIAPIAILIVVGIGGVMILRGLQEPPQEATETPKGQTVFAERVTVEDLQVTVTVQGEVRASRQIAVAPQISGRVSYVSPSFVDGGAIKRGQMLVKLEAADYELAAVRAQSGVASAEQRLLREQAEAEIALQDLNELGLTDASPLARREPQLAEARASLEAARAQLKDAELALKRTAVYAPFTGRVQEKSVDVGQFASPGQMLGTIFATDVVEVSLPITDDQLGILKLPLAFNETKQAPGPEVTFAGMVGGEQRLWKGRITRTGATVNSRTRLISAIGEVQDPYGAGADNGAPMAPGLFVEATIAGSTLKGLYKAPRSALRGENQVYVGLPDEGTLKIKQVTVAHSDPTGVYISDGIDADSLLIVSPLQAAFDGMSLEVYERTPDGELIAPPERKTPSEAAIVASGESDGEEGAQ